MAYTKTNWVQGQTKVSAAYMNKIEDKLEELDRSVTSVTGDGISVAIYTQEEKSKLSSVEDNATRDMTSEEIKAAYESNVNTNAYTDEEKNIVNNVPAQLAETENKIDNVITISEEISNLTYEIVTEKYLVVSGTTLYAQPHASYDVIKMNVPLSGKISLNFIPSYNFSYFVDAAGFSLGKLSEANKSSNYVYGNFPAGTVRIYIVAANDQRPHGYIAIDSEESIYTPERWTCEPLSVANVLIEETNAPNEVFVGKLKDAMIPRVFEVGAGKAYTKIKDAVEEAVKYPNSTVYIGDGDYDMYQEYGGATYFDSYAFATHGGGLYLYNGIRLVFSANSRVLFHYPGTNSEVMINFSPFNAKYNGGGYTIENAVIECSNCRYCIHDEHAGDSKYYETHIIRCHTKLNNLNNTAWQDFHAIAGGLGGNGIVELRDSIIESEIPTALSRYETAYWHNHDRGGIRSEVVITGNYFAGEKASVTSTARGTSTLVTTTLISNNSLGKPVGIPPGEVNNKMYVFNNEVRNP